MAKGDMHECSVCIAEGIWLEVWVHFGVGGYAVYCRGVHVVCVYCRRDMQGCSVCPSLTLIKVTQGSYTANQIRSMFEGSLSFPSIPLWVTAITPETF